MTIIDHFNNWPEAFPMKDVEADTIIKILYNSWICRYGCPVYITTDQGSHVEPALFNALPCFLRTQRIWTAAYHSAANGLIERWHKMMKAAIKCLQAKTNWTDLFPTALCGLRTSVQEEILASPSEFLFGTTLRLPGELFSFEEFNAKPVIFWESHIQFVRELQPIPAEHCSKGRPFIYKNFFSYSHALAPGRSSWLEQALQGPFEVVNHWQLWLTSQRINKTLGASILREFH